MKRMITGALLLVLFAMFPVWAQDGKLTDDTRVQSALGLLETWIDAERAYKQIPGLSVGIVHDQDLIWSDGFGYSNREQQVPATAQTIYSICSISKLFTSIGVMQLRDQGHLNLRDSVGEHLPWFDITQTYPDRAPVTIRGLLTHSSGLPREPDFPSWTGPDYGFPTREQVIERIGVQETLYPGDTYYQYSNLGMTVAGMVVAEVSGQSYEDYVKANILDPLGLENTRPEMPEHLWGTQLAPGYGPLSRDGTRVKAPFFQARGMAPAAGYSSTVEDLAEFASWQFRLLEEGGDDVLDANTLREMHRVQFLDTDWQTARGLGFGVSRVDGRTFVGHGGSCPGYQTNLRIQPDSKIATIVMANASGAPVGLYTRRAFEIVGPAIEAAIESPGGGEKIDPALLKYTGTYSAQPWGGGETVVLPWKKGLAMIALPTDDPVEAVIELEHIEENVFRRIRDDGELAEEIVFEMDENGEVTDLKRRSNFRPKVQ